jgi:hypothetical protein
VTAEYGSDLSLSCTFHNGDSDETVGRFIFLTVNFRGIEFYLDCPMALSKSNGSYSSKI